MLVIILIKSMPNIEFYLATLCFTGVILHWSNFKYLQNKSKEKQITCNNGDNITRKQKVLYSTTVWEQHLLPPKKIKILLPPKKN